MVVYCYTHSWSSFSLNLYIDLLVKRIDTLIKESRHGPPARHYADTTLILVKYTDEIELE